MCRNEGLAKMNRVGFLFLILASVPLFAENPSVAHFCVQDFVKDRNSYDLVIRPVGKIVPEQNTKWPDSLTCGKLIWKNKSVVEYKNEQIVFKEGYDADLDSNICNICTDEERLRKKVVSAPLMKELKAYEYYSHAEISGGKRRPLEMSFIKELYGKNFSVEWISELSCYCPSYSVPDFKTKLDIVIDGECARQTANSVKSASVKANSSKTGDRENSTCSCSKRGKCAVAEEEENVDLAAGMLACYNSYSNSGKKRPDFYASSKTLDLDGSPEGTDASLGCFNIRGETYLVVGSNLPSLQYHVGEDAYTSCYEKMDNSLRKRDRAPYFSCAWGESTPNGCKTKEHGVNLVFDSNGKFTGWDYDALSEYANRERTKDGLDVILLPAHITGNVLTEVGNDAARKTAGMAYFCGTERVDYKKYKQNHLASLKDALKACNARKDAKKCTVAQAKNDSIADEKAKEQREWYEQRKRESAAEKKAYYDKVKALKKRLKKDSTYIKMVQAYKIFKRYAATSEWTLKKGVDYAKVLDSVETLRNPFFDRLHQRSKELCKDRVIPNDTLKELSNFMFSLYTGGRKKDYFVEEEDVVYTTKPCVADTSRIGRSLGDEKCEYSKVDRLCVDTKGTKAKRIFLTVEDYEILDVFMGCDRYTGKMNRNEGEIKRAFLPIETHYNPNNYCVEYGSEYGSVYLDLTNREAVVRFYGCMEKTYKEIDGVWKKTGAEVTCFY